MFGFVSLLMARGRASLRLKGKCPHAPSPTLVLPLQQTGCFPHLVGELGGLAMVEIFWGQNWVRGTGSGQKLGDAVSGRGVGGKQNFGHLGIPRKKKKLS